MYKFYLCGISNLWSISDPTRCWKMGLVPYESSWKMAAISHKESLSSFQNSSPLSESFCNCFNTCWVEKNMCLFNLLTVQPEAENRVKNCENLDKIHTQNPNIWAPNMLKSPTIFEYVWPSLLSVTSTQESYKRVYWVTHSVSIIVATSSLPSCQQSSPTAVYLAADDHHLWQWKS